MKKIVTFALLLCMVLTFAACTQPLLEVPDTNSDLTVYVKWGE